MKYIRTKDKIVKHPHPNAEVFTFRYEIVKQADTITDLCDRFVLITNRAHYGFGHFSNIKRVVLGKEEKFIACYGAIWTGKGLIYVAKMNDKGELELL